MYKIKEKFWAPATDLSPAPEALLSTGSATLWSPMVEESTSSTIHAASDCTGSSASIIPYCASASIASSYASYNSSAQLPSTFENAYTFRSLLDKEESTKRAKVIEQEQPLVKIIHKKAIIQVPSQPLPRCNAEQQYNPSKSYGANLIDWVVCSAEDFVKRLSKFF